MAIDMAIEITIRCETCGGTASVDDVDVPPWGWMSLDYEGPTFAGAPPGGDAGSTEFVLHFCAWDCLAAFVEVVRQQPETGG